MKFSLQLLDCEQSLFFFRFSKGSASARALSSEAAKREKRGRRLSRLAPSVTRVVICVSRAFCSTDQEKKETARSLTILLRKPTPPTHNITLAYLKSEFELFQTPWQLFHLVQFVNVGEFF